MLAACRTALKSSFGIAWSGAESGFLRPTRYRAVLLDWRGVVALDPEPSWWVRRALASLGRRIDPEVVDAAVAGIAAAGSLPEILEAERYEDCSTELNRSASMLRFEKAGLDAELADALYQLDSSPKAIPYIQTYRTCSLPSERLE